MEQQGRKREPTEEQKREEEEYDTFAYKFQQQIIDAWKPVPYTRNNVILYSVLSVVCIVFGLVLILTAPNEQIVELRYDDSCSTSCSVSFELTQNITKPLYLYYGLTGYYQNHRRYMKFFSAYQMEYGNILTLNEAKEDCGDEAATNGEIGATTSITGAPLVASDVAFPCGQKAKGYMTIKEEILNMKLKYANGSTVVANKTKIAWPDDTKIYKNSKDTSKQAIDNEKDENWLVWYRSAAKSKFFKLQSRYPDGLPAGKYTFETINQLDTSKYGEKWFHLSTSNYVGNKDNFLGIAFLALGGGCVVVLIIFIAKCVTEMRERPKSD